MCAFCLYINGLIMIPVDVLFLEFTYFYCPARASSLKCFLFRIRTTLRRKGIRMTLFWALNMCHLESVSALITGPNKKKGPKKWPVESSLKNGATRSLVTYNNNMYVERAIKSCAHTLSYSWIGPPVHAHERSIPERTGRATYDNSKTTTSPSVR